MSGTTIPATVRIVDLPPGATISGAELVEAVQTVAGVGLSVQLSLNQIVTSILGALPTGGGTGQILNKTNASNFSATWSNITQFVAVGTSLSTTGSATSIVAFVANQGISSSQILNNTITSSQMANNAIGTNQLASSLGIASSLSIGTVLTVAGTATFNGTAIFNGTTIVNATTVITGGLQVVGTTLITGTFGQVGTSLMTGVYGVVGTALFTSGAFGVVGTSIFTGPLSVIGTAIVTGRFTVSGTTALTSLGTGVVLASGTGVLSALANGTTGYGLFSNGTTSAPSWTGFLQAGTGGTTRTWNAKVAEQISVVDFGATGDGVTDDTTAIQNAFNAATSGAGVYFPPGTYIVSSALTITVSGVVRGENSGATVIKTSNKTADIFTYNSDFTTVRDIQFASSTTKTAGACINFNNHNYCEVRDFVINGTTWFTGVTLGATSGATGARIKGGRILGGQAGVSNGILISQGTSNSVDVVINNMWIVGNTSGSQLANGIQINNVGDCTIDHVSTVFAGNGLTINPGGAQTVQALFVTNSFFDSGSGDGIGCRPTSTGLVQLVKISNSWICTNNIGVTIAGAANSNEEIEILGCTVCNNAAHGILLNDTSSKSVRIVGGSVAANVSNGIIANTNAKNFTINGVRVGPSGQFGVNGVGINLVGGNDTFIITSNDVSGNTINLSLAGYTGTTARISDNIGYNPVGVSAATNAGASPFTYTAGPSPETHYVKQTATNTAIISKGGQQIATLVNGSTYYVVQLEPNESYVTTWTTTTPTYTKDIH